MVSCISDSSTELCTSTTVESATKQLSAALIDTFAKRFGKAIESEEELEQKAKGIIQKVDTDKDGSMSLAELRSADLSNCSPETARDISYFANNFKSCDKDGNGKLCLNEIKEALKEKQYSIEELSAMAEENDSSSDPHAKLGSLASSFVRNLLKNYDTTSPAGYNNSNQ